MEMLRIFFKGLQNILEIMPNSAVYKFELIQSNFKDVFKTEVMAGRSHHMMF